MNTAEPDLIKEKLKSFLAGLSGKRKVSDSIRLIDEEIIDSLNFVQLIIFIESEFKITLKPLDIHIEDFSDVSTLSDFIARKMLRRGGAKR
ncbi:MAG: acyl carrier protein [Candidatus Omnitrophica bacterium]|nr:acyl carrier protein [Candidatus Omnitrophota bacterium]